MENWQQIITPAVVSAVITGISAPLLFYWLKRRDDKKKRNFEVRYTEYKKYLQTLEEVVSASRIDFEKSYMTTVGKILNDILTDPENSNRHLLRLNQALDELGNKMRESFTKSVSELHGLRLVCSDKLLSLVDGFVQLQRELMDESIVVMGKAKNIDTRNPEASISGNMKEKAAKAEPLFNQILIQMRKELDINGS